MSDKTIEQVLSENTDGWMEIPGVVAVAQGLDKGRPCIVVLADTEPTRIRALLGTTVDGYPIVVRYSGPIKARNL